MVAMNFRRGFFRGWLVFSIAWIGLTGWNEYYKKPWNMNWGPPGWRIGDECWDRLAKWPDGTPYSHDDGIWAVFDEYLSPGESDPVVEKRNQWRETIRQNLRGCEAAAEATLPIAQRISLTATRVWQSLGDQLRVILLPPVALLVGSSGAFVRATSHAALVKSNFRESNCCSTYIRCQSRTLTRPRHPFQPWSYGGWRRYGYPLASGSTKVTIIPAV
jgi:hypothetical protein